MNIEDNGIDLSSYYLLRVDFSSFIITGYRLSITLDLMRESRVIELTDIANNYLIQPLKEDTKVCYQKLYNIKSIELQ